jgi:DNA primase
MIEKYEIQKLRELPVEAVAERLGLQVTRHKALCPFHDDRHPSLSFSVRRNTFRCFVCGASGGPIDLVMKYLDKDFPDACRWLADENNVILTEYKPQTSDLRLQTPFDASRYERFFERPWLNDEARQFLFDERRLDARVVRWCRLTSWKDRQGVPWLQIPYYDREGRLVGVQNRNLVRGATPRFRFPSGSECGIYNLPVLNRLRPRDELWITEGCSDCWAMLSAGHKAIAIPSATLLTRKDVELLQGLSSGASPFGEVGGAPSFHMYPDRDAPGERLFLQLQQVLPTLQHHQLPPDCKDFSEYYVKGLGVSG